MVLFGFEAIPFKTETSSRALSQLKEKYEAFTTKLAKLEEDEASQKEKRKEVIFIIILAVM